MSNNRKRTLQKTRVYIKNKRFARLRKMLREAYSTGIKTAKQAAVYFDNWNRRGKQEATE